MNGWKIFSSGQIERVIYIISDNRRIYWIGFIAGIWETTWGQMLYCTGKRGQSSIQNELEIRKLLDQSMHDLIVQWRDISILFCRQTCKQQVTPFKTILDRQ
jgi:hypothetical protein